MCTQLLAKETQEFEFCPTNIISLWIWPSTETKTLSKLYPEQDRDQGFGPVCCVCAYFTPHHPPTSLSIIYLVLEHDKHLGQLQSFLNVLWNHREYELELQTAHISFQNVCVGCSPDLHLASP